ncbi:hypothetical protein GCM10018784_66360 [Streptomyces hydrogenans]|nr:hypothetical protein GCM10018784_66360 [Streptomyces hydrogenans]
MTAVGGDEAELLGGGAVAGVLLDDRAVGGGRRADVDAEAVGLGGERLPGGCGRGGVTEPLEGVDEEPVLGSGGEDEEVRVSVA